MRISALLDSPHRVKPEHHLDVTKIAINRNICFRPVMNYTHFTVWPAIAERQARQDKPSSIGRCPSPTLTISGRSAVAGMEQALPDISADYPAIAGRPAEMRHLARLAPLTLKFSMRSKGGVCARGFNWRKPPTHTPYVHHPRESRRDVLQDYLVI